MPTQKARSNVSKTLCHAERAYVRPKLSHSVTQSHRSFCLTANIFEGLLQGFYCAIVGNSAKVFVLSFCSPLCNFVHGALLLNPLYFSIMKELSTSSVWVLIAQPCCLNINKRKTNDLCTVRTVPTSKRSSLQAL